jgi:hypothetical protein
MTSLIRLREPSSIPFIRETTSDWPGTCGAQAVRFSRSVCAGTDRTTRSAPSSAAATSVVAFSVGGSVSPGRYRGFSWSSVMAVATSACRAHSVAGVPASHRI